MNFPPKNYFEHALQFVNGFGTIDQKITFLFQIINLRVIKCSDRKMRVVRRTFWREKLIEKFVFVIIEMLGLDLELDIDA